MGLVRHKRMAAAIALMAIAHAGYARSDAPKENDRSKLLGAREGTELARMALQYRPDDGVKPDCSHLVNQIYREAGLNFRFASSSEIYAGIDPFQRVRHPQPGDLIVWRGHVGIVVNPREHSFYSSLRSGLNTDYYDADYWTRRGTPRFYRYRVSAQAPASPRLLRTAHRPDSADDEQKLERTAAAPREIIVPDRDSSATGSRFLIAEADLPGKPTAEDLRSALLQHIDDAGSALESSQALDANSSVLVVDDVQVEKLKLRKDQGSLEIRLDCSVAVVDGQVTANPLSQKRKLNLQHAEAGWMVEDKDAPLYVPRQIALRVFATQLAMATRQDRDQDIARLLRILNALAPEK